MAEYSQSMTSRSLLVRLRDENDQEAWREFVERYKGRIYYWCRAQGLNETDCEDARQQVLMRLIHGMKTFHYDPAKGTFRGWLKSTTRFAVADIRRGAFRTARGTGDSNVQDQIANMPDDSDFVEVLADALLLHEAESRVQANVSAKHWQTYLMSKQGVPRPEIAEVLNMSPGAVSTAVYRIAAQLKQLLKELGGE